MNIKEKFGKENLKGFISEHKDEVIGFIGLAAMGICGYFLGSIHEWNRGYKDCESHYIDKFGEEIRVFKRRGDDHWAGIMTETLFNDLLKVPGISENETGGLHFEVEQ